MQRLINWSSELVKEAKALREQGKSYSEIATVINQGRPGIRSDGRKFTHTNAWYACTQVRFTAGGKQKKRKTKKTPKTRRAETIETVRHHSAKPNRSQDVAAVFDLLAELLVAPVSEKLSRRLFANG